MFTAIRPILIVGDISSKLNVKNIGREYEESIVKLYNTINSWLDHCKNNGLISEMTILYEKYRDIDLLIDDVIEYKNKFQEEIDIHNTRINEYFDNSVDPTPYYNLSNLPNEYDSYKYYEIINGKSTKNKLYVDIIRSCDLIESIQIARNVNYEHMILYHKIFLYTIDKYTSCNNDCLCYWPLIHTKSNIMTFYTSDLSKRYLHIMLYKMVGFSLEVKYTNSLAVPKFVQLTCVLLLNK